MTKLWHDDVRRPPDDSWEWARTNDEAMAILRTGKVTQASLDHDLGLEELDPDLPAAHTFRGTSPNGDGLDLVKAMIAEGFVPETVTVHSWNMDEAMRMARLLADAGANVTVSPFRPATP